MDEKGITFVDYTFTRHEDRLVFDPEITLDKLNLKAGQFLQVCQDSTNLVTLLKVDPVVAFVQGHEINTSLGD